LKYPNLEAERVRAGYSRRQVADAIGVNRDVYCAWMDGEYPIPANFCRQLSAMYSCSLDYLLAGDSRGFKWRHFRNMGI